MNWIHFIHVQFWSFLLVSFPLYWHANKHIQSVSFISVISILYSIFFFLEAVFGERIPVSGFKDLFSFSLTSWESFSKSFNFSSIFLSVKWEHKYLTNLAHVVFVRITWLILANCNFLQQIWLTEFTKHLPYATHCARLWE